MPTHLCTVSMHWNRNLQTLRAREEHVAVLRHNWCIHGHLHSFDRRSGVYRSDADLQWRSYISIMPAMRGFGCQKFLTMSTQVLSLNWQRKLDVRTNHLQQAQESHLKHAQTIMTLIQLCA